MRRRTPSPAMVVACLALFIALGGTGYAASGALSSDSPTASIAKRHRRSLRGPRGPRGFRGATGATGPQGPQGPQGVQGPAGTARAYAEVTSGGRTVPGHAFNIADANITHPGTGIYCFNLSGIGVTTANAAALATADWNDGQTLSGDMVQVDSGPAFQTCPAGQVEVLTYSSAAALNDAGFVLALM